nr:radical SAM protein [Candidatus Sigynarchaeota archaeon]
MASNTLDLLGRLESIQSDAWIKNCAIVQSIPVEVGRSSFGNLSIEETWKLHNELHERFKESRIKPNSLPYATGISYHDVKTRLARHMLASCSFCERKCSVDRVSGKKGSCGVGIEPRVCSAFLHFGEESPLVPSGTIFFAGCNFKCAFCQNDDISTDPSNGHVVTADALAKIAMDLGREGAKNINYVGGDPTPNMHLILESMKLQQKPVAQLWNSNFYNTVDAIKLLMDVMDIWLPDLKYGNNECAKRLSGIDEYWTVVTRNLKLVHDEMAIKGWASLVIRHLVLPGHIDCCSIPCMEWIAKNLPHAMVNVMAQYRPQHLVLSNPGKYKEITRRPTYEEIDTVRKAATSLGICWKPVS